MNGGQGMRSNQRTAVLIGLDHREDVLHRRQCISPGCSDLLIVHLIGNVLQERMDPIGEGLTKVGDAGVGYYGLGLTLRCRCAPIR